MMILSSKKLIIFDLDDTLAESKSPVDMEMLSLMAKLSRQIPVAIISGGQYQQFEKQVASRLVEDTNLDNISLFPTSGASYYKYSGNGWHKVYAHELSPDEVQKIFDAFPPALKQAGISIDPEELHGEQLEDRNTQVSWSALGQQCPGDIKKTWDPDREKRHKILPYLIASLPDFDVRIGGTTTIDITQRGIDKGFGIHKMKEYLNVEFDDMLFVGDSIFPGGNDYACVGLTEFIRVKGVSDTKKIIQDILADKPVSVEAD